MTWSEYMMETCGYETKTTFWEDFSIADRFGIKAIKDTYNRAFRGWKDNVTYITEMSLVLNHKCWWFNDHGNTEMSMAYQELWEKLHDWCLDHLKGDDIKYYLKVTD